MVTRALRRRGAAATTLQDYVIEGAAELGECSGAQSFRATHRSDGQPVLLHKFRPAESLIDLGPVVAGQESPDFTRPFVTQFTDLFTVAGSAYLIEPLPPSFALSDVWRYVLQKRPDQALGVITVALHHLVAVIQELTDQNRRHGALSVNNIVLAGTSRFGVLAAHVECREGRLWLRHDPESPVKPDFHALADVLGSLLSMEAQMANQRNAHRLLPAPVRHSIHELLRVIERTKVC